MKIIQEICDYGGYSDINAAIIEEVKLLIKNTILTLFLNHYLTRTMKNILTLS